MTNDPKETFEAAVDAAVTEFEAEEAALNQAASGAETPVIPPTAATDAQPEAAPVEPPVAPAEEPPAAEVAVAAPETVPDAEVALPVVAEPAAPDTGEEYEITSNSGRTRVRVRFEPDVMGTDGEGQPVVLRTGEGMVTITRDGQNIFAQPLMREQPLS